MGNIESVQKSPETEYEESLQQFQIISEQIEKLTVQDRETLLEQDEAYILINDLQKQLNDPDLEDDAESELAELLEELEEMLGEPQETKHLDFIYHNLARIYFLFEDDEKSIKYIEDAISYDSKNSLHYLLRSEIALENNDFSTSITFIKLALDLKPDNPESWQRLSTCYENLKIYNKAIESLLHVCRLRPNKNLIFKIANLLLLENDKSAKEYFLRVVEMDPQFSEAWESLGNIWEQEGNLGESLSAYQRAVEICPSDVKYRGNVIQILSKMGKFSERDVEIAAVYGLWRMGKISTSMYCREKFEIDHFYVDVFEYFTVTGNQEIKFEFVVNKEKIPQFRVTLGSYQKTNAMLLESQGKTLKDIASEDDRFYHLDSFYNGYQETYEIFPGRPSYEKVKEMVSDILIGKRKPLAVIPLVNKVVVNKE